MKHPIEPPSADRKLLYPRIFHEPLQVVGGARMATIQSYIHERELYVNNALILALTVHELNSFRHTCTGHELPFCPLAYVAL